MAHRIFVTHMGQRDSAAYGYFTATKNKACQIAKKKKKNLCKQSLPLRPKTCTQAHLLNQPVTPSPNVPKISYWRRNISSIIRNLQSTPKITESGFPEWGKQQNIAHGICPIVRSQCQRVNGSFPSSSKHRELDNTFTRNRATSCLVPLSNFGFQTNSNTSVVADFV